MKLYNYLTDKDKSMIYNEIKTVCRTPSAELSHILRFWNVSKSDLFSLFNNQLILEKDIDFVQPLEDIVRKYSQEVSSYGGKNFGKGEFIRQISTIIWKNLVICTKDGKRREFENWRVHAIDDAAICSNKITIVDSEKLFSVYVELPDGSLFEVVNGMKTMRFLKKIADAFNVKGYEEFRQLQSQYTNTKHIKGKLCLSIHPLDYMTMSDNASGWSSCMSWFNHGQYYQGTVEMMNSPCVVVAYIKSTDTEMTLLGPDSFKWNNKMWRELFLVNRDFIVPIKGYPYQNENFENEIREWLRELAAKNWGCSYSNETYSFKDCDETRTPHWCDRCYYDDDFIEFFKNHNIFICYPSTNMMYNDFSCGVYNLGIISTRFFEKPHVEDHPFNEGRNEVKYFYKDSEKSYDQSFFYSGASECMCCGNEIFSEDYEEDAQYLLCTSCDDSIYCDNCGRRLHNNSFYTVDGVYLCEDCFDNETVRSPFSGVDHLVNNGREKIYIVPKEEFFEYKNSKKEFDFNQRYILIPAEDGIDYGIEKNLLNEEYLIKIDISTYLTCAKAFNPQVAEFIQGEYYCLGAVVEEELQIVAGVYSPSME